MKLNFSKLAEYRVPELHVEFVNRRQELTSLLNISQGRVSITTGPRGCGKTELFKVFTYLLEDLEDYNVIFITYDIESNRTYIYTNSRACVKCVD